jgi:hypothetical protein
MPVKMPSTYPPAAAVTSVQVIPSVLVIILFVPELATATNRPLPKATEVHVLFTTEAVRPWIIVQFTPSVLRATRNGPESAKATQMGELVLLFEATQVQLLFVNSVGNFKNFDILIDCG